MAATSSAGATQRASVEASTLATVQQFNEATTRRDVNGMMALMTDDVVFENTFPSPDGERHEGQAAVGPSGRSYSARRPVRSSRRRRFLRPAIAARCAGSTAGHPMRMASRATCEAWTSSACATGRWPLVHFADEHDGLVNCL
jgi:hypothetical protein